MIIAAKRETSLNFPLEAIIIFAPQCKSQLWREKHRVAKAALLTIIWISAEEMAELACKLNQNKYPRIEWDRGDKFKTRSCKKWTIAKLNISQDSNRDKIKWELDPWKEAKLSDLIRKRKVLFSKRSQLFLLKSQRPRKAFYPSKIPQEIRFRPKSKFQKTYPLSKNFKSR